MFTKSYIASAALLVAITSCSPSDESAKKAEPRAVANASISDIKVAPELKTYFSDFQAFVKKHDIPLPRKRLEGLQEIVVEEPKTQDGSIALGVVGICYEREFEGGDGVVYRNRVAISPDRETLLALETTDKSTKEEVIRLVFFHEMGHCLGGLGHTDPDKPRGKLPVGVMDTFIPSAQIIKSLEWEDLEGEFATMWKEENQ